MFDYEKLLLYDTLLIPNVSNSLEHSFKHKHLWVKKATRLRVTEFFLRLIAWLCVQNNDYRNSQMCIVTGPRIDLAIRLIDRLMKLFITPCYYSALRSVQKGEREKNSSILLF